MIFCFEGKLKTQNFQDFFEVIFYLHRRQVCAQTARELGGERAVGVGTRRYRRTVAHTHIG